MLKNRSLAKLCGRAMCPFRLACRMTSLPGCEKVWRYLAISTQWALDRKWTHINANAMPYWRYGHVQCTAAVQRSSCILEKPRNTSKTHIWTRTMEAPASNCCLRVYTLCCCLSAHCVGRIITAYCSVMYAVVPYNRPQDRPCWRALIETAALQHGRTLMMDWRHLRNSLHYVSGMHWLHSAVKGCVLNFKLPFLE